MIGVIFLGRNLGWFTWDLGDMFRLIGPVALILFGLNMMACGNRSKRHRHRGDWTANGWNPVTPPSVPPVPPEPPLERQGPPPAPPLSDDPNAPFSNTEPKGGYQDTSQGHAHWSEERRREKEERWQERLREKEERWRQKQQAREERRRHHGHGQWWDHSFDPNRQAHSRFIGDVYIGQDYWELRPMSISHFIGDTTLDLTKAQIPLGETRIYVSGFIGDVKVFVPNDLGVGIQVVSSSLIGDVKVLDHKRGGFFNQMTVETPSYSDTDKRIVLIASSFIGDVRVTKVG
ncbi:hypothetical protein E5161_15130 [Cohnella pontilimi]|uniref:Cell wall-active antibiotics response LiaF-like C-terminal domain-containing protein n=2 Tax=Cohnella pontilimi TaxID=2564100 RepID=A0A4U0F948_9BACL|nr:hypothetical protein E5161_15130 [Cohnella pontilimi]